MDPNLRGAVGGLIAVLVFLRFFLGWRNEAEKEASPNDPEGETPPPNPGPGEVLAWRSRAVSLPGSSQEAPLPWRIRARQSALSGLAQFLSWMGWKTTAEEVRVSLLEFADSGLLALGLVFLIIRPFVVQAFFIPSGSMEPTLFGHDPPIPGEPNDRILVNKFIYWFRPPQRQDIIVFKAPAVASTDQKEFIKRLIGLPGDRIEVRDGQVWVNGERLDEPYLPDENQPTYQGEWIVPEGRYFVLGDNRNNSHDSHRWGHLERSRVQGKAMLRFWPLRREGRWNIGLLR